MIYFFCYLFVNIVKYINLILKCWCLFFYYLPYYHTTLFINVFPFRSYFLKIPPTFKVVRKSITKSTKTLTKIHQTTPFIKIARHTQMETPLVNLLQLTNTLVFLAQYLQLKQWCLPCISISNISKWTMISSKHRYTDIRSQIFSIGQM